MQFFFTFYSNGLQIEFIHSFKSLNNIMVLAITQFDMDSSSIFSYVLFGQIEKKEGSSNPKFK